MLTERQRRRCAEIAAALDRNDLRPWLAAEASLSREERGAVWDERQHVRAKAEQQQRRENAQVAGARRSRVETESASGDLDFWASDDEPDDGGDDDDEEQQETRTCPTCNGKGRTHDGKSCARCGGSGRVPIDDLPGEPDDDEEDEDEIEEKSYAHDFEEE